MSEYSSLSPLIEEKKCYALNQNTTNNLKGALTKNSSEFLESEDDEQLLITLAFRDVVKVAQIQFSTFNDGRAPKTIKLFVNSPNLDFNDAESESATQTFVLTDDKVDENDVDDADSKKEIPVQYKTSADGKTKTAVLNLRYVKFQKVTEITLFVEDNLGDEDTSVIVDLDLKSGEKAVVHVEFLKTQAEFDSALEAAGEATVFVDFTAGWCGPCKKIAPAFQTLSESTTAALFYKVDVDANAAVAQKYSVTAMPTFMAFKRGAKVAEMRGADEAKLAAFVAENL